MSSSTGIGIVSAPSASSRTAGSAATATAAPAARDAAIDLLRAGSLAVVIALHAMMVGVQITPDGPVFLNAMDGQPWFAAATWIVQVMPVFFIVGGFSALRSWRAAQDRGTSAARFVALRLHRLLVPSLIMLSTVTGILLSMLLAGVPAELVAVAGFRISQPLWFLAVYLMLAALVPVAAHWHRTAPGTTLAVLVLAVVSIDGARLLTGIEAIGILNLLAVWALVQQLGFWLADGHIDRVPGALALTAGVSALGLMALLTGVGFSADMFVNLNPPTVMIVLLALAQLCAIRVTRATLTRLAVRPRIAAVVAVLNRDGMTIYLWHMPIMIGLTGLLVLVPLPVPELHSPLWWATRPLWIGLVIAALVPVVPRLTTLTARISTRLHPRLAPSVRRVALASSGAVVAIVVVLAWSFSITSGLVAVAGLLTTATLLTLPPRGQRSEERRVVNPVLTRA